MNENELFDWVVKCTGSKAVSSAEIIQELWSGYGTIQRLYLEGFDNKSIIVKVIMPPNTSNHPRGWNTDFSHKRKLKSYDVELSWYRDWSIKNNFNPRWPAYYGLLNSENEKALLLEDLDTAGFYLRKSSVTGNDIKVCLTWLARFHGRFLSLSPKGLWNIGSYWHLQTRPDEYEAMRNNKLKNIAYTVDEKLNKAEFKTIIHGDAKLANFCFSENDEVAAVDFQYAGCGCGIKDIVYFFSSCLDEVGLMENTDSLLDFYFQQLLLVVDSSVDVAALEKEWRELYPYAWVDFYRFLDGWMPEHSKINSYMQSMLEKI